MKLYITQGIDELNNKKGYSIDFCCPEQESVYSVDIPIEKIKDLYKLLSKWKKSGYKEIL